jgi:Ca2+/Na+ antiporter
MKNKNKNNILYIILILLFIIYIIYIIYLIYNTKENFQTNNETYVIITTCLLTDNFEERKEEYKRGINSVIQRCKDKNYKLIIIENNGKRETFLDTFNIPVLYTNNNSLNTNNKGVKELYDVLSCIDHYKIKDNDFIIKMTGRYYIDNNSLFFDICDTINETNYDVVIKYGWWRKPSNIKINDCITGLIGMRCKYIKQINFSLHNEDPIEWEYAKVTQNIDNSRIKIMDILGLNIKPVNDLKEYIKI